MNFLQMLTRLNRVHSPAISKLVGNIPANSTFTEPNGKEYFYVKNIGEDPVIVQVQTIDSDALVETKMFLGWNVEMVKKIVVPIGVTTLQYGY